jgi:hypothetical protein
MAASVLNRPLAVEMSIFGVRSFVKLRSLLTMHKQLATKLTEVESKLSTHDTQIMALIDAIKQLMTPPPTRDKRRI